MKFNVRGDKVIYFLVVVAVIVKLSHADVEQSKSRRASGGTAGLFAFPRVGRSDPVFAASNGGYDGFLPASYEEYDDYPKMGEIKRGNLIAFPRVGRSENQLRKWAQLAALEQSLNKRTSPSANSGLWFGPRLGRIQKRNAANIEEKDDQL